MKRNTPNSTISINQSTPEVSHKDAVTSTESHPSLDVESTTKNNSTYASFYWLINYIKMCISRLTNDVYTSLMSYWFPGRVLLPPHILHLMLVQNRLRAERESHTVTYSRELPGASTPLSMRKIVNAFTSYILSSEDEAVIHYTPKDLGYLRNDPDPMFVLMDANCVSNPSSNELHNDKRFHVRDPVLERHFNKNTKPVEVPSTSRDPRNDLLRPLMESDSTDEMQMIDINLQSDNNLLDGANSECDTDSIDKSYLKTKYAFLDLEGTLMSTKKKSSLLESVPKLETIVESELFNAFPIITESDSPKLDFLKNEYSDEALNALIPSFPASTRSSFSYDHILDVTRSTQDTFSNDEERNNFKAVTDYLHRDHDFLIAAELGDENMLHILIEKGTNIHVMDHIGRNALHLAVHTGNRKVVALLLAAGVDPNVKDDLGMTPLCLCLMRSPSSLLAKLLLDNGALLINRVCPMDTGLFLQFVMMCVPTIEEEKILRLLVEHGGMVNDPEAPGGRQALHFAAMSNNTYLINILVDLGANLFDVNHRNETPKQVAATFHCKAAFALLEHFEQACLSKNVTTNELGERD